MSHRPSSRVLVMTPRAALRRRLGFTMIEVLLVVGVAAIMSAMVVPRMTTATRISTSVTPSRGRRAGRRTGCFTADTP